MGCIYHLTDFSRLVATLLGKLRLSAGDAIRAYEDFAESVFSDTKGMGHDGIFKASKLEEAVKRVVRASFGPENGDALMCECTGDEANECRAYVT